MHSALSLRAPDFSAGTNKMATGLHLIDWRLTMTTSPEVREGVDLKSLSPGSLIDMETKNRHYRIEYLGGTTMRISGHPAFCPSPVVAELQGSVNREGICEMSAITPGKRVVFVLDEHIPVTTSKVVSVHVDRPDLFHRLQ